jgi:hypothetical protein
LKEYPYPIQLFIVISAFGFKAGAPVPMRCKPVDKLLKDESVIFEPSKDTIYFERTLKAGSLTKELAAYIFTTLCVQ